VIAGLQRRHAAADIHHDTRALVPEDHRKQAFGIRAGARELVGVAHAARFDLDQHLAVARPIQIDRGDFERFTGGIPDCGLCLHGSTLVLMFAVTLPLASSSGTEKLVRMPRTLSS
jgi:hypothetical protein